MITVKPVYLGLKNSGRCSKGGLFFWKLFTKSIWKLFTKSSKIQVGFCRQMVILQKWLLTQVWLYSHYVLFLLQLISILFFRFLILMDYNSPTVNLMLAWLILVLIGHEVCSIAFILVPYGINFLIKPIFGFIKQAQRNQLHQLDSIKSDSSIHH